MTAIPRGPQDLQAYIDAQDVAARLIAGLGDTPTVPAAAAALGVECEQIVKTLLFLVEQPAAPQPVVVVSCGEQRVDKGRLAERWGVGKKRVTLAPAGIVLDLLGYPAGGVPPFGHRTSQPMIIDAGILDLRLRHGGVIYAGGGDDHTMLELTVDELLRVTGGEIYRLNLTA